MKLIHTSNTPKTKVHGSMERQRLISPGEVKSEVQTVNYVEQKPGESFEVHSHPDCEEYFFIIEGDTDALIGNTKLNLKKGDLLIVEVGENHSLINNSQKLLKYLQFRVNSSRN